MANYKWIIYIWLLCAAGSWAWLLPPWEGFDEAQHYAYAQYLVREHRLPVLGRTAFTPEVWASFSRNPVSLSVQRNYPALKSFDQARAGQKNSKPVGSPPPNYEAQHAPLAYLPIGIADYLLAWLPIEVRLRVIRCLLLILAFAMIIHASRLLTPDPWRQVAGQVIVFTTEMFYGVCGLAANDWLALPLFVWIFAELRVRSPRAGPLLALGLLVKSYFLAIIPAALMIGGVSILPWLLLAVPWYARNLWLYQNLTGMQEHLGGTPWSDLLVAGWSFPWFQSAAETFRQGLWLGNSSFVQWSPIQGYVLALLLLGGFIAALIRDRDRYFVLVYSSSYFAVVCMAALQANVFTHGQGQIASPWYATPLWVMVIMYGSAEVASRLYIRVVLMVWALWFAGTYWVKLVPWYGGVADGRSTGPNLFRWYSTGIGSIIEVFHWTGLLLFVATTCGAFFVAWQVARGGLGGEKH